MHHHVSRVSLHTPRGAIPIQIQNMKAPALAGELASCDGYVWMAWVVGNVAPRCMTARARPPVLSTPNRCAGWSCQKRLMREELVGRRRDAAGTNTRRASQPSPATETRTRERRVSVQHAPGRTREQTSHGLLESHGPIGPGCLSKGETVAWPRSRWRPGGAQPPP